MGSDQRYMAATAFASRAAAGEGLAVFVVAAASDASLTVVAFDVSLTQWYTGGPTVVISVPFWLDNSNLGKSVFSAMCYLGVC